MAYSHITFYVTIFAVTFLTKIWSYSNLVSFFGNRFVKNAFPF